MGLQSRAPAPGCDLEEGVLRKTPGRRLFIAAIIQPSEVSRFVCATVKTLVDCSVSSDVSGCHAQRILKASRVPRTIPRDTTRLRDRSRGFLRSPRPFVSWHGGRYAGIV